MEEKGKRKIQTYCWESGLFREYFKYQSSSYMCEYYKRNFNTANNLKRNEFQVNLIKGALTDSKRKSKRCLNVIWNLNSQTK